MEKCIQKTSFFKEKEMNNGRILELGEGRSAKEVLGSDIDRFPPWKEG